MADHVIIELSQGLRTTHMAKAVRTILERHPGKNPVFIVAMDSRPAFINRLDENLYTNAREALADLKMLLGASRVSLVEIDDVRS